MKSFGVRYFRFVTTDVRMLKKLYPIRQGQAVVLRSTITFLNLEFLQPKFTRIVFKLLWFFLKIWIQYIKNFAS